jgi:hypothetical protein
MGNGTHDYTTVSCRKELTSTTRSHNGGLKVGGCTMRRVLIRGLPSRLAVLAPVIYRGHEFPEIVRRNVLRIE